MTKIALLCGLPSSNPQTHNPSLIKRKTLQTTANRGIFSNIVSRTPLTVKVLKNGNSLRNCCSPEESKNMTTEWDVPPDGVLKQEKDIR